MVSRFHGGRSCWRVCLRSQAPRDHPMPSTLMVPATNAPDMPAGHSTPMTRSRRFPTRTGGGGRTPSTTRIVSMPADVSFWPSCASSVTTPGSSITVKASSGGTGFTIGGTGMATGRRRSSSIRNTIAATCGSDAAGGRVPASWSDMPRKHETKAEGASRSPLLTSALQNVVRTLRSAASGRPEGLHDICFCNARSKRPPRWRIYSDRNAWTTSTRDARAAGIIDARIAAATRIAAAPATGSAPGVRTSWM